LLPADAVAALEGRLGCRFEDQALLERALTHTSWAHEHAPARHHDALAFVGDAALSLVVAERLYDDAPDAPVGVLTPARAELVADATLTRWASALELGALLRLGRGEDLSGGRARASILATTLEAVLGVVYLEGGLPAVRAAVARLAMIG
jgi:ribonuclease-3